jgi:hypothetical protein
MMSDEDFRKVKNIIIVTVMICAVALIVITAGYMS